jgi:hypothetical protein
MACGQSHTTHQAGHPADINLELPALILRRCLNCFQEAGSITDTECGIIAIVAAGKTLQKMRKHRTGWRIEELQAVAEENSVEWRRPGRGGSHVIFSAPGVREIVSVPAKRPIKPIYIKKFLALIDAVGGIGTK